MTQLHEERPAAPSAGMAVSVSVVICAYTEKRWDGILAAVDSVRRQRHPAAETILVIDHNPVLQERLAAVLPDVVVTANQGDQGLSGGRNTGIALASGDVVAFLDDDAVADPAWLARFADAYTDPAVAGVGGLTLPRWETARPAWFPEEFGWVVGCSYRGMPTSPAPVRNLHGGNASFRREVFDAVGGFSTGIGRTLGKRPLGCEETELCIRLGQHSRDSVLLYENRAVIWHLVPAERCRFSYFRSRCYAEGLSKALVTASVGSSDGLSAERRYTTSILPRGVARGLIDFVCGRPSGLARAAAIISGLAQTTAGYLLGTLALRSRRRRSSSHPEHAGLAGGHDECAT